MHFRNTVLKFVLLEFAAKSHLQISQIKELDGRLHHVITESGLVSKHLNTYLQLFRNSTQTFATINLRGVFSTATLG